MDKNSNSKKFIKRLLSAMLVVAVLVGGIVYVFDPFYHYHKPWFGLKAVLTDKEYQCIGTLRNFDYDTLIVGSSVVENNDNDWYDEAYGGKSIKAVRSYGATADLCYMLDVAYEGHDIKRVFYNIDPSSLAMTAETTFESTGCPTYLYDKNPFNDVRYLYNKDVLLEKIPYEIANSFMALGLYHRAKDITPMMEETVYQKNLEDNIALLTSKVEAHPETEFIFFYPVYSMLWWDGIVRSGERDAYIYNELQMTKALLQYDNVRVFCFQAQEEVATNLEIYMDTLHFAPEINKLMLDEMIAGENEMTLENYEEVIGGVRDFSDKVVNEYIVPYEEKGLLNYAEE